MTFTEKVMTKLTGEPGFCIKKEWIPFRNVIGWEQLSEQPQYSYEHIQYIKMHVIFDKGSPKTFLLPPEQTHAGMLFLISKPAGEMKKFIQEIQASKNPK